MQLRQSYSKEEFLAEYALKPRNRELSNSLARDVQEILHEVISDALGQIVERLNACGHNLRFYEEPVPGALVLRDDRGEGNNYVCDLRLAVDTTISTGFRDTVDADEIDDPLGISSEP